jgi:hypothetical protein
VSASPTSSSCLSTDLHSLKSATHLVNFNLETSALSQGLCDEHHFENKSNGPGLIKFFRSPFMTPTCTPLTPLADFLLLPDEMKRRVSTAQLFWNFGVSKDPWMNPRGDLPHLQGPHGSVLHGL